MFSSLRPLLPRLTVWPVLAAAVALSGCASTSSPPPPRGQIQQVGFVWLKRPGDVAERRKVVAAVHRFVREIPEIESASVGAAAAEPSTKFTDQSFDVSFVLRFRDDAARERYNAHPVHQKAAREVFLPLSRKLLFYRFITE